MREPVNGLKLKTADCEVDVEDLQALTSISGELVTYGDTILLRDTRIVLPSEFRERAMQIAHEGHQGITKNKSLHTLKCMVSRVERQLIML